MDELARTRWWSLVGGLVLAVAGFFPLNNSDGYGHLAQGRNIVELGHVPSTDPFSLWKPTPATWHNYEWGFDLAIYAAYESVGPTGIVLLKCLVLFGLGVLLVRFGARLAPAHGAGAGAAPWLTAALVTLAIPAARFRLTERPHVLGLAFAAVLLLGLHALATDRTRRPWHVVGGLVALHVLWVNCHGSHLLGLMLTGAHAAALVRHPRLLLRVGVLLALQVAASGISPFGYGILTDAIEHVVNPEYRGIISEWEAWSPDDPGWYPIALFLQTGLLLASMRTLFRTSAATRAALFASVLLAIMAVRSVRFIGEYIVLTCPMLAAGLAPRFEGLAFRWRVAAEGAALAAALGLSVVVPPDVKWGAGESEYALPAASGDFLAERFPEARLFASIADAWYLMWKLPRAKFLIDGRAPFYGPAHVRAVTASFGDPAAMRAMVDRFGVDTVVLEFTSPKIQTALGTVRSWDDWRLVYVEDWYAAWVRTTAAERAGIDGLSALPPTYEFERIVDPNTPVGDVWRDLRALGTAPNGEGYRSWVKGLLELRPLFRRGALAGVRAPTDDSERARAKRALAWFRRASERLSGLPMVEIPRAMAALDACELDEARNALAAARRDLEGADRRETLLLEQEIAVRAGETERAQAFLRAARAEPGVDADPSLSAWLPAIAADLEGGVRCP